MAFQLSKYQKRLNNYENNTYISGYPYEKNYHNLGQLRTPYQGKNFGKGGDYGPIQNKDYYTVWNRNYPYPLDKDLKGLVYLPTEGQCYKQKGYFPCTETKYPDFYIPGNYYENCMYELDGTPNCRENFRYEKLRNANNQYSGTKNFYPFPHSLKN